MVAAFNTKFFFAKAKYTLAELGCTRQYAGKDLVEEEILVNVCLHGMNNEYRVFLENLTFPSFSKLMEAARQTNEPVRRTPKPSRSFPTARPFGKRKQTVAAAKATRIWVLEPKKAS